MCRPYRPHPPRFARHLPLKGKACGRLIAAPTANPETFLLFRRGRTPAGPPYLRTSGGASPSPTVLKKLFWDWVGEALGPPAVNGPGTVRSAASGVDVEPQQRQFLQTQGPVARREFRHSLRFPRAENFLPGSRGNPRKWGPGKGEYERGALILSRPRWRFAYFAAMGKVGRRPQAAKSLLRGTKPLHYRPLIRPSVRTGAPSPQGEGLRTLYIVKF